MFHFCSTTERLPFLLQHGKIRGRQGVYLRYRWKGFPLRPLQRRGGDSSVRQFSGLP
jgi:hypothetical protein